MKLSETQIQKAILTYLTYHPEVKAWRVNTGKVKIDNERYVQFGFPGMADILGIRKGGQFLAIEVKSAKGKQTEDQAAFAHMVEKMGGTYILARSLEDVQDVLDKQ